MKTNEISVRIRHLQTMTAVQRHLRHLKGDGMSNEDLAAAAGYATGGGAYNNPRGRLRTLGLVEYVGGLVRARDILFPTPVSR